MSDIKHCVVRTDLLSGTKQPADLVSVRYYGTDGEAVAAMDNGTIVELMELEPMTPGTRREIWKAKAATSASDMAKCAIVCNNELMYDERQTNLDEYFITAGEAARGYIPRGRNIFSMTPEGFENTAPTKGQKVVIGTAGKLKQAEASAPFGTCIAVEKAGRYTYHVIQIAEPASGTTK